MTRTGFEALVWRARHRGIGKYEPPRSVRDLARTAGVTPQMIYALMRGDRGAAIRNETAEKLAKALGVTVTTVRRAIKQTIGAS